MNCHSYTVVHVRLILHSPQPELTDKVSHVFLQGRGIIVLGIAGTVQQSDVAFAGGLEERLPRCGVGVKLGKVSVTKLLPLGGVVPELAPQVGTGRYVFDPAIECQILFPHASGP